MAMTNGIVVHTLAVLGYILFSCPTPPPRSVSYYPVASPIQVYVYVVKNGDTLTNLAERYYGSDEYWTSLWNDNPEIVNPSDIVPGMRLKTRVQSPVLVESVDKQLMVRLLEASKKQTLDPRLAFVEAENGQVIGGTLPAGRQVTPTLLLTKEGNTSSNFEGVYQEAGMKFGVPWQVLYGLHLTESGLRDGAIASRYGTGPQGPMQFMPGTFNAYAVDGNGDGATDINNAVDAIYTAANYLAKHGTLANGLRSYGGNTAGVLAAACQKGYCIN